MGPETPKNGGEVSWRGGRAEILRIDHRKHGHRRHERVGRARDPRYGFFQVAALEAGSQPPQRGSDPDGATGLKPGDLSSAAASFIDGSGSNLILAYTSPDRG